MNILFLNYSDYGGGAARAAVRLLHGVQRIGVEARMLVYDKRSFDPSVIGPRTMLGKAYGKVSLYFESICLKAFYRRTTSQFSADIFPDTLVTKTDNLDPDIVHLHWVAGGFLKLESLARLNRPLVWTLHDSWAFTGGCHIPFECVKYRISCGACPVLGSKFSHDLSRYVWKRKQKAWGKLPLTVVAPSNWLASCARSSSLFAGVAVRVIPNGVDTSRFKPFDKKVARDMFGLPHEKQLVLFGGVGSVTDRNKGFAYFIDALQELQHSGCAHTMEIVLIGESPPEGVSNLGMPARHLGFLSDEVSIALLYAAVDALVVPSIMENLPNVIMEAMACGTPCVAFNQGGIPDLIEHETNGYLARPYEPSDLTAGIRWVLEDRQRWLDLSARCREKVVENFAIEVVAQQHKELYTELLINRS